MATGTDISASLAEFGDMELGAWGFLRKIKKGLKKAAKFVVKNPVVNVAVTGAAVLYPPVGIPAKMALEAARRVDKVIRSKVPSLAQAVALRALHNTKLRAKKGDKKARLALRMMAKAAKQNDARARVKAQIKLVAKGQTGYFVSNGRIRHGKFYQ